MTDFSRYFENETVLHAASVTASAVLLASFFMTVFSF